MGLFQWHLLYGGCYPLLTSTIGQFYLRDWHTTVNHPWAQVSFACPGEFHHSLREPQYSFIHSVQCEAHWAAHCSIIHGLFLSQSPQSLSYLQTLVFYALPTSSAFFLLEVYAIIDTICSTRRSSLDSLCPLSTTTALSATSLAGWHPPNAVNWSRSQNGANLLGLKLLIANRLHCPHCLPLSLMQRRYSILQQVQQHTKYNTPIKPRLTHLPLFLLLLTHSSWKKLEPSGVSFLWSPQVQRAAILLHALSLLTPPYS